jgi:AcrR family transcriptional regulator
VDAIVTAAIALADAEGMAAVSMRTVGKRLGRTGMALYTYVPSKSELVDLMYDRVLAELPGDYDLSAGWRAALTSWAEDHWEFCLRHPWVLRVSQARPVLGPNEYATLDTLVRLLFATGLEAAVVRRLTGTVTQFVRGAARIVAESRQAPAETGISDEDWWFARTAALTAVAPDFAERYPSVRRMETEGAVEPPAADERYLEREATATFNAGLAVMLDGIEAATASENRGK